jgi:hypothetical protein
MVTLKGLIRTMTIVKNPASILALKLKKTSKIIFSNGAVFQVTYPQFRCLRDDYGLVKKYRLQQVRDETFKITTDSYQLIGSLILMYTIDEIESGVYDYDYRDKVVLDIGGFEGDSAAFFGQKELKKL